MNKIKVTLSESNPPRIGDELEIGGKLSGCTYFGEDAFIAIFEADWLVHDVTLFRDEWLGMVVTRTEEEDGA